MAPLIGSKSLISALLLGRIVEQGLEQGTEQDTRVRGNGASKPLGKVICPCDRS